MISKLTYSKRIWISDSHEVIRSMYLHKPKFIHKQLGWNSFRYKIIQMCYIFCSIRYVQLFATSWMQHTRLPFPLLSSRACSNSCPLSQMPSNDLILCCLLLLLPSIFPVSGCFAMSQLFASGDQCIGASASASVLPRSIQGWFILGLTDLISLLFKGLSRVFSNTTVQKH